MCTLTGSASVFDSRRVSDALTGRVGTVRPLGPDLAMPVSGLWTA